MRNLAIRLVLWLCARYDIHLVNEVRTRNGRDAVARAEHWEAFAREEGGLYDMIEQQRRQAFEAYSECRPGDTAEMAYLAQQERCWKQIKTRIDSVIQSGRIEADKQRKISADIRPIRKSV